MAKLPWEEEKNLYKNKEFTSSFFTEEALPEESTPKEGKEFKLEEILGPTTVKKRDFLYDSEAARNFDETNVKKAKEGMKELVADAIQRAKTRSQKITEQARKEGYKEGYDEGFAQAFKKGEEEAKKEFSPLLETIQNLIEDLSIFREKMYPKLEREMVELVVNLTKKVIHFELSTREDSVIEMIQLAVQSVLDKESMVIKINQDDKSYAESFRPELHHMYGEIKNITFEAHSGIARGGCVIESNFGIVDARLEKLDERIETILNLLPPIEEDELPGSSLAGEDRSVSTSKDEPLPETPPPVDEDESGSSSDDEESTEPPFPIEEDLPPSPPDES